MREAFIVRPDQVFMPMDFLLIGHILQVWGSELPITLAPAYDQPSVAKL